MGAVIDAGRMPELKIGTPSHWLRYLVIVASGAALGGALWAFESFSNKRDAVQLSSFQAFRSAYAEQCGVPEFAGPQPQLLEQTYLTSPAIQVAIDKARVELQNGANCEDVAHELKAVDFVVPKPAP